VIYPCSGNVLSLKELNVSGLHSHDFSPAEKRNFNGRAGALIMLDLGRCVPFYFGCWRKWSTEENIMVLTCRYLLR
jgi:hypothetical protein